MDSRKLLSCFDMRIRLTLKTNVSLKTGFSVFLCTLVSNFFFLSGKSRTLTYGSEVPPESMDMRSAAWRMPTVSCVQKIRVDVSRSGENRILSGKNTTFFLWGSPPQTAYISPAIHHHKRLSWLETNWMSKAFSSMSPNCHSVVTSKTFTVCARKYSF